MVGERIDIRGLQVRGAQKSEIVATQIVKDDDDDVWLAGRLPLRLGLARGA